MFFTCDYNLQCNPPSITNMNSNIIFFRCDDSSKSDLKPAICLDCEKFATIDKTEKIIANCTYGNNTKNMIQSLSDGLQTCRGDFK